MHDACTRKAELASRSLLTHRPADEENGGWTRESVSRLDRQVPVMYRPWYDVIASSAVARSSARAPASTASGSAPDVEFLGVGRKAKRLLALPRQDLLAVRQPLLPPVNRLFQACLSGVQPRGASLTC